MARRSLCLVALLVLVMVLSGCLVTKNTYVKKEEEAATLANTVAEQDQKIREIAARNEQLQAENLALTRQVAEKDDLLQKKSEETAKQNVPQAETADRMDPEKAEPAKPMEEAAGERPAAKKPAGLKSIRMKVLSGEGKIDSARRMSKRLTAMGYKVEIVGMAETADYPANTVYFTANYKKEAKALASRLGKNTIVKPLFWKSVFNLIVVTGG